MGIIQEFRTLQKVVSRIATPTLITDAVGNGLGGGSVGYLYKSDKVGSACFGSSEYQTDADLFKAIQSNCVRLTPMAPAQDESDNYIVKLGTNRYFFDSVLIKNSTRPVNKYWDGNYQPFPSVVLSSYFTIAYSPNYCLLIAKRVPYAGGEGSDTLSVITDVYFVINAQTGHLGIMAEKETIKTNIVN